MIREPVGFVNRKPPKVLQIFFGILIYTIFMSTDAPVESAASTPDSTPVNTLKTPEFRAAQSKRIKERMAQKAPELDGFKLRYSGPRSAVELHPKRMLIEKDLLEGKKSARQIAKQYGLSNNTISRYRLRIMKLLDKAAKERLEKTRASLVERVDYMYEASKQGYELAKDVKHFSGMGVMMSMVARSIELYGDLSGVGGGEKGQIPGGNVFNSENLQVIIGVPKVGAGVPRRRLEMGDEVDEVDVVEDDMSDSEIDLSPAGGE